MIVVDEQSMGEYQALPSLPSKRCTNHTGQRLVPVISCRCLGHWYYVNSAYITIVPVVRGSKLSTGYGTSVWRLHGENPRNLFLGAPPFHCTILCGLCTFKQHYRFTGSPLSTIPDTFNTAGQLFSSSHGHYFRLAIPCPNITTRLSTPLCPPQLTFSPPPVSPLPHSLGHGARLVVPSPVNASTAFPPLHIS
ncbi:hypothetical protein [Absidia glauca]|uniref:Uncharacterized protein n=1 Tax=Absidia glauca TaxID=4829 RepID=A0A168P7E4_ABSGL|nr:hypothetical protein [Absidia glauca]